MGEEYGILPTDVMRRNPQEFWLNASIRAATAKFKNDAQREAQRQQGSPGVATPAQKRELAKDQEERADRREQMEAEGRNTATTDDQLSALEEFQEDVAREERLKGMADSAGDSGPNTPANTSENTDDYDDVGGFGEPLGGQ